MSLLQHIGLPSSSPEYGAGAQAQDDRAIIAVDLVKDFETEHGRHRVLDGVSFRVGAGEKLAVLGRNGSGKSTLIKLLSGFERLTSGHVHRGLHMSWPLGLGGAFEGELTGYDNVRFIARVYGAPFREVMEFVEDFTELGQSLYEPLRVYSDGMRARLALAISLAIDFECLLIDEVLVVGDHRFQKKCLHEIFEKRFDRSMILAIHAMDVVEDYCSRALVLDRGRGRVFDDLKLAVQIYNTL